MIKSKLELKFYIASDRIMNGFPAKRNLIQILKEFVSPQKDILRFLRLLRKVQYYNSKKGLLSKLISILIKSDIIEHLKNLVFLSIIHLLAMV